MKKIVLNISDTTFEKLRFEAIHLKKSVRDIIEERLLERQFSKEVEEAYDDLLNKEFREMTVEDK